MSLLRASLNQIIWSRLITTKRILIKKTYQQINHFIIFKGARKFQIKKFFYKAKCFQYQKSAGADLKSVANNLKYMF